MIGKKSAIGVDIGHATIKIAQIERTSTGWNVTRVAKIPTPKDAIRDGIVVDTHDVGYAIKDLLKDQKIHASVAHLAVSGANVMVRNVRIPRMPEATLRKSIKFEAGRYVQTSVDDSYIEFEIVGVTEDSQMDVIIVAAPRELVESRIRVMEELGIDVESMDVEAFASYRSLVEAEKNHDWSNSTFALVDFGAANTKLTVVQQGLFVMSRTIPGGSGILSEALKSYFKLSDEDAEAGKAHLDASELILAPGVTPENPPLKVIQPHLDELVREIRRSLNYHQSQLSDGQLQKQVSALVLTGGGANLKGMATYMEHKLALKTLAIGVFDNPRFTSPANQSDNGLDLSVAAGLAMRSFVKAA